MSLHDITTSQKSRLNAILVHNLNLNLIYIFHFLYLHGNFLLFERQMHVQYIRTENIFIASEANIGSQCLVYIQYVH
jgi:hypothetical protein